MSGHTILLGVLVSLPLMAANLPKGCELGVSTGQDANLACYEDLDKNGDGALSRDEAEALPRIKGRFEKLDADGNGLLSPNEFQADMTTPPQRAGAKGI
jgi:hypothetical protein